MPKIIFLTSFLSPRHIEEIRNNSKGAISNANTNFQLTMLDGVKAIRKHNNIEIINLPNIGAFPLKYKSLRYKANKYIYNNIDVQEIGFINLVYIKKFIHPHLVKRVLKQILNKTEEAPIIFLYDINPAFINPILKLRDKYDFLALNVIPDLPGMTGTVDNVFYRLFHRLPSPTVSLNEMDGYILLNEHMADKLKIDNKPYIIMEGIYSESQSKEGILSSNYSFVNERFILYTGAVDQRNGVINLITAFRNIKKTDIKLVICGDGDANKYVLSEAKQDPRIIYLGQVPHSTAIILPKKATLLVNPRLASQDFSKYSFPSKTLEYMASGTPLLMYKLASLPKDYIPHLFCLEEESIATLTHTMSKILDMSSESLDLIGAKARNFIIDNKTSVCQMNRLWIFAQRLYYEKFGKRII